MTKSTKKTGGATGTIMYSPARIKRMEKAKRRTEARWAEMAGPVTIRFEEPTVPGRASRR